MPHAHRPFDLDETDVDEIARLSEDVPLDHWHTDGCQCDERRRKRMIVDRYGSAELWACVRCGGLYWMDTIDNQEFEQQP